ncbi:NAD(P)/FAD-dependent oxidoreductase [Tsuneonella sp. HG222]
MRRKDPLIVGAGPAGCAAAITLARGGASPLLIDRDESPGDALCGGFLSWKTAERLAGLGLDVERLGAHSVGRLALFGTGSPVEVALPHAAWGLSRRALDTALRGLARAAGASFAVRNVRNTDELTDESTFLATGKHDLRGASRPRESTDPALGVRLRLQPSPTLARRLAGKIELHLFDGGYAGIVLQEGGSANLCMAVRKSLLAETGGSPEALLEDLAKRHGHFALRLESGWHDAKIDTIGSVPYGWIATSTEPGLFRIGDQAAVIPSLAGEGIDIALSSGISAAEAWLSGSAQGAPQWQAGFAQRAQSPVRWAEAAWKAGENPALATPALALARMVPSALLKLVEATRLA